MALCPDCYSQVGSLPKHRPICLVRSNQNLRAGLESIEFWLGRMEGHLNAAYRAITRYTQVGPHPSERKSAVEEFESAAETLKKIPALIERIQGYHCERVAAAQLRASVLGMQAAEVRDILPKLSAAKRGT